MLRISGALQPLGLTLYLKARGERALSRPGEPRSNV